MSALNAQNPHIIISRYQQKWKVQALVLSRKRRRFKATQCPALHLPLTPIITSISTSNYKVRIHLLQARLALATKAANSEQSCSCPMITRCHHPRSSSIPKSTTRTSVHLQSSRQPRQDLPRHPQEELVASTADEVSPAFHPEPARRTQPR